MTLNPSWDAHLRSCHDVIVAFPPASGLPTVRLDCVAPDGLSRQRILVAVEAAVRPQLPHARAEIEDHQGEPVVIVYDGGVQTFGAITLEG